jgi:hypothetical protein
MGREVARHLGGTGVPGDMIGQQGRFETKGPESPGDPIRGVITQQHDAAAPLRVQYLDGGWRVPSQQSHGPRARLRLPHRVRTGLTP